MKKRIFLGLLVLLGACKTTSPVIDKAQFSDNERIGGLMNYLASDDRKGRDTGSEGIEEAASFIMEVLRDNKIAPLYQFYQDSLTNYQAPAYNIVGVIKGSDPSLKDEVVLLGAHYDHIGMIGSQNGDSIANGANDNASGTSTVLELARYFGKVRNNKRTLVFGFFTAEEKGLLGSKHLAVKMKEDGIQLYSVLNFEMTGIPMADKDYLVYVTGFNKSNIAEVSNVHGGEKTVGFLPTAEGYNLFMRSDNYPFYEEFKIPAHTFSTFDFTNFDHYHKVGDEAAAMDFDHMARVVNKMIPVVEGIINAPSREIILK